MLPLLRSVSVKLFVARSPPIMPLDIEVRNYLDEYFAELKDQLATSIRQCAELSAEVATLKTQLSESHSEVSALAKCLDTQSTRVDDL